MRHLLLACTTLATCTFFWQRCLCVPSIEIQALKDFYISTNGINWYNNTNWGVIADYNVESNPNNTSMICVGKNLPFGIECDSLEQHVISISFENNGLNGTLPSSLSNLHFLKTLMFYYELGLYGSIPDSLYNLTQLETFELAVVSINGTISNLISNWINMKTLKTLVLADTLLTGIVPSSIWYIDSLITLDLEINLNNLTVIMSDEMCNLKNIQFISLSDTNVQGIFPGDCICSNWIHLEDIYLGYWYYMDVIYDIYGNIPGIDICFY